MDKSLLLSYMGKTATCCSHFPSLRALKRETCLCLHLELSHQPRHPLQQPQTTHDATFNSLGVGHKQMQVKGGGSVGEKDGGEVGICTLKRAVHFNERT